MRLLLVEFASTLSMVERVWDALTPVRPHVVGWAARGAHLQRVRRVVGHVDTYPLEFASPSGLRVGVSDVEFDAEQEESILYLLDREQSYANALHQTQRRLEIIACAERVLATAQPTHVLFSDVPHNVYTYVIQLLAEQRQVVTYHLRTGGAPHLFTYASSIGSGTHETWLDGASRSGPKEASALAAQHINRLRGEYASADPVYMKRQRHKVSVRGRARGLLSRPGEVVTGEAVRKAGAHLRREWLRRAYERKAYWPDLEAQRYVVVFLHLQPERTSCPEGGRYAQQLRIVEALDTALPSEWSVLVREHPSTFMPGPKLVRGHWAYEAMAQFERVTLVPLAMTPFELIDNATMVATITGTVGLQALARRTPVAVFGSAPYVDCEGAYPVRSVADVQRTRQGVEMDGTVPEDAALEFLRTLEASPRTFAVGPEQLNNPIALWSYGAAHQGVLRRLLSIEGLTE